MNIEKILAEHNLWLTTDGNEGTRADLSGVDLSGADLSGADLIRADLRRTDLSGAYLSGADLRRTDLRGAYLSGADLSGADLSRGNLIRANLRRADLCDADLWDTIGDGIYIKNINTGTYSVCYVPATQRLQIGCKNHSFEEWRNFNDAEIYAMDGRRALAYWAKFKDKILGEIYGWKNERIQI